MIGRYTSFGGTFTNIYFKKIQTRALGLISYGQVRQPYFLCFHLFSFFFTLFWGELGIFRRFFVGAAP